MAIEQLLKISNGGMSRPDIRPGARLTEELWNSAHGTHANRQQLHHAAAHGWGVLTGLQVTATEPASRFVTIHPGAAIDPLGRLIVVTENERDRALRLFSVDVVLDAGRPTWLHFVLELRDNLTLPAPEADNNYVQVLEYAHCEATPNPPTAGQIELARVLLTPDGRPVANATDPLRPKPNEIDLRFRTVPGLALMETAVIGQVFHGSSSDWQTNLVGLTLLIDQARRDRFQVKLLPVVRLVGDEIECDLLYITCGDAIALNDDQIERLRNYVAGGGVVLVEGTGPKFEKAGRDLAAKCGITVHSVGASHPLLSAHHVFGTPPEGGAGSAGSLQFGQNNGLLYLSSRDYGAAWEGRGGLSRAQIRDAQEFGINIIHQAVDLKRSRLLERLAPPQYSG